MTRMQVLTTLTGALVVLGGCAERLQPQALQARPLPVRARSVAIELAPEGTDPALIPAATTVRGALLRAGFTPIEQTSAASLRLVLTTSVAPRRVGGMVPAEDASIKAPEWIVRPRKTVIPGIRSGNPTVRVSAILFDGRTGEEVWRATLSQASRNTEPSVGLLTERLLRLLPTA